MTGKREEIGLYVHIPFCVRKCRYCDFLSAPASEEIRDRYVKKLRQELEEERDYLESVRVRSVFWGGGTPSLLSEDQFEELAGTIRRICHFSKPDVEWTIESNPGTLSLSKARQWKEGGVNRVSLGMQAAQDPLLARLGRIHTYEQTVQSVEQIRAAGFTNLNLDLMMGLPGQSEEMWEETLDRALAFSPEHLSCYSLIVEEGTRFFEEERNGTLDVPDEETERHMYARTREKLLQLGWEQYEISNFARPGYACVHNLGYWDLSPYLGVGLGAASYVGHTRRKNTTDLAAYLASEHPGELRCVEEEDSLSARMEEMMILGLRRIGGVSEAAFADAFQKPVDAVYGPVLQKLVAEGLLARENGRIFLSRRGLDLANVVWEQFLLED